MTAEDKEFSKYSLEFQGLTKENAILKEQIADLTARIQAMQKLFLEMNLRLQMSSTSIKAAVSSVLAMDFFWDESTQHEFLETIDSSINEISNLVKLMNTFFRIESNNLEITVEPQILQEILTASSDEALHRHPHLNLELTFPERGQPVLVDYEYLKTGFLFLFEFMAQSLAAEQELRLQVSELSTSWEIVVSGFNENIYHQMENVIIRGNDLILSQERLLTENTLKAYVATQLFNMHNIHLDTKVAENGVGIIQIHIPSFTNKSKV